MISAETMKWRLQEGKVAEFDLVFWKGTGRVVGAGDDRLSLQVRGKRADYTWDRVRDTWRRLQDNHALTVDELGGGHDAVGLVSLFAVFGGDELEVVRGRRSAARCREPPAGRCARPRRPAARAGRRCSARSTATSQGAPRPPARLRAPARRARERHARAHDRRCPKAIVCDPRRWPTSPPRSACSTTPRAPTAASRGATTTGSRSTFATRSLDLSSATPGW